MLNKLKKVYRYFFVKHRRKSLLFFGLLLLIYWFCLPNPLFKDPTSMVLEDRNGILLGAKIAEDGQWRFPMGDSLPQKYIRAVIEFEDRRFYYHPGIDPIGLGRAMIQNIRNGKIVSGGSTISMQVIRLARKNKARTIFQKVLETIMATRLELRYSKEEILQLYANNAPFGGNVVGIEAAAWRYFGKSVHLLSWAEAAMLAVLPNSPGLIHPGRNRQALFEKRNRLLDRLQNKGEIDQITCQLAKEEPLPEKPHPLPRVAPHLLERARSEYVSSGKVKQSKIKSTLDFSFQRAIQEIVVRHHQNFRYNEIHNLAALVLEVETGNVIAYVGNVTSAGNAHSAEVDIIKAPRSTGSILKPFLYALMIQEGQLFPESLIPDIPTILSGYRPENFYEQYDGVVTAKRALVRSLNIPLVYMLQRYGLEKLHFQLQKLGIKSINKAPSHYGLPLILGGAEASLWEITNTYACIGRMLGHFYQYDGQYNPNDFRPANYILEEKQIAKPKNILLDEAPFVSASAAWFTFEAMQEVQRPSTEGGWQDFDSERQIAWKTGTSFGFRDAWAVGITPKYTVGVWVGNADGEGRPGLIGIHAAAPVLFDIFQQLDAWDQSQVAWFEAPFDEFVPLEVCQQSGYRALAHCPSRILHLPKTGQNVNACPYHQIVHLDKGKNWQVNSDCEMPDQMQHLPWFVLPPIEEFYYKVKNPNYRPLPPFRADCQQAKVNSNQASMQLIYPKHPTQIYVPIDLNGEMSRTVFSVAHRNPNATIYWHIDQDFIGSTQAFHQKELQPEVGKHILTLVDDQGSRLERTFEIIVK